MSYLYTKETKSSFEIEHIKPDSTRTERFIALLQMAESEDFCEKPRLIDLQNRIVDPRFRDSDYRTSQNYVGEDGRLAEREDPFRVPETGRPRRPDGGLVAAHKPHGAKEACPPWFTPPPWRTGSSSCIRSRTAMAESTAS